MKLFLCITISLLTFSVNSTAQIPFPGYLYEEMYFNAYVRFMKDKDIYIGSKYEETYLHELGTLYSLTGKYETANEYYTKWREKQGYIPDSLRKIDLSKNGITQTDLNELYSAYNVVMFNESHHFSRHRAFVYSQLESLKSLGFNQLALETLNENDTLLTKRKYPVKKTGFYTNDPVYGNLIRKALELGYTLIPYDSRNKEREKGQAENICKKYDPDKGKLIVYGGYGHTAQKPTGKITMMGQYFIEMIHEDILSISQFTQLSIQPVFPDSTKFDFFLQKDTSNYFDYYIYANPKPSKNNIPYWYNWMNFKSKALNELLNKPLNPPALIQILNINEPDAVPVYQYLIEDEAEDVYIAYPNEGEYILKIIDITGETEYKVNL